MGGSEVEYVRVNHTTGQTWADLERGGVQLKTEWSTGENWSALK